MKLLAPLFQVQVQLVTVIGRHLILWNPKEDVAQKCCKVPNAVQSGFHHLELILLIL